MDRQNIYPSACFTKEGMLVMWSPEGTKGSIAGPYDANIGGGKRAILALPAKFPPSRLHLLRQSRSSRTRIIDETPFTLLAVLLLVPLAAIGSFAAHFAFNSNSSHALLAP